MSVTLKKMIIPDNVKEIMQKLLDNLFEAYVIGGAVRDAMLDIVPHDYDIFTNATGQEILDIFPDGKVLGNEERQDKILTVIVDDIEVSQFRSSGDRKETGTTLIEHQATCDFTINALACDINGIINNANANNINGHHDIVDRILRFVGKPEDRIAEDPLRVLRGIRFKLKYRLTMDSDTDRALDTDISHLPKERIREELMKILSLDNLHNQFLKEIVSWLPEELTHEHMFKAGGDHHAEVPYDHLTYAFLESYKITNNPLIRLSVLLHDVAKGVTRTEEDGEIHFYEHEKVGSILVKEWMTEMKFSKEDINYVYTMIKLHMFGYKEEIKDKAYIKFFNKLSDAGIPIMDYIMMIYSDHQGNMAKKRIKFGDFLKTNYLYNNWLRIRELQTPFTTHDLKIGGKDLIERYSMPPSPDMGMLLNEILETIMDGDLINERAEIFAYIEEMIENENDTKM